MKIRLENPALNNLEAYGRRKWKTCTMVFEVRNSVAKWFSNSNFTT